MKEPGAPLHAWQYPTQARKEPSWLKHAAERREEVQKRRKAKNTEPSRGARKEDASVGWSIHPKGTQQVPKNWVAREGRKMELEHHGEHRSIALDGGDTKAANRAEPPEEIRHLGEGRPPDGVALRVAPGPVNRPLQLIVGARGWTARQRSLRHYRRGETSRSGESLDSLQA